MNRHVSLRAGREPSRSHRRSKAASSEASGLHLPWRHPSHNSAGTEEDAGRLSRMTIAMLITLSLAAFYANELRLIGVELEQ